jgi:HAD superfamily hydrolase (TIGR01549 family)
MMRLSLFDMDGTVFENHLDWPEIRKVIGIESGDILETLYDKDDPGNRRKMRLLEDFERANAERTTPQKNFREFMRFLKSRHVKTALITNNSRRNTDYLLEKFRLEFDLVMTRETRLWKPNPAPMIWAMNHFNMVPSQTISIGDSRYDIQASYAAGIERIYIIRNSNPGFEPSEKFALFSDYLELMAILKEGSNVDAST